MVLSLLVGASAGRAADVNSFSDFMDPSSPQHGVRNENGDPLLLTDTDTGVRFAVPNDQEWQVGFINYVSGGWLTVGYGENLTHPDYSGLIRAFYNEYLSDGERPDDIWLVWDQNKDGIGWDDGATWYPGTDDAVFMKQDILFGPRMVRSDASQLPAISHGLASLDYLFLPHMVLGPVDWSSRNVAFSGDTGLASPMGEARCHE